MSTTNVGPATSTESVLYVNDAPKRADGHAHIYDPDRMHVVAVTYLTTSGRATRVSFHPHTGDASIQIYEEER